MNNLLKHQKGDIERNKKKNKVNKSKYSNILKKTDFAKWGKKEHNSIVSTQEV